MSKKKHNSRGCTFLLVALSGGLRVMEFFPLCCKKANLVVDVKISNYNYKQDAVQKVLLKESQHDGSYRSEWLELV